MRISIDRSADAAYIHLVESPEAGSVARTYLCDFLEVKGMINIDFDENGKILGIELINASQYLCLDDDVVI